MNALSDLTDTQLDAAFAASFDVQDFAAADFYGAEIRTRLVSVSGFLTGVFGYDLFPLYEARTGFSQSEAAQSSLAQSAGDTASAIGDKLKLGLGGLAVFAIVAVGVYAYFGRK